ncbi:MAG: DUF302 domain-containing protein, partial [Candidatus Hodarchaeota archaeon]
LLLGTLPTCSVVKPMVDVLRKESTRGYDETVAHIEKKMVEEGFSHIISKPLHKIFENKLGIKDYPGYTIILGCGVELAKMALDVSKDVGTLYPCSFVVYEDEGKVMISHVSIMKAAVETNLAPADKMVPVIEETGKKIQKLWDKI